MSRATIHVGNVLDVLPTLEAGSVRCCVTSPPYWGLRNYGAEGQLGLEPTPDAYVANMVRVFREVRRVLADDGTLWLNLGDSYSTHPPTSRKPEHQQKIGKTGSVAREMAMSRNLKEKRGGLPEKNLVGIPWRVAFALQADGWYLRSDIIWAKPNPMPESVTDRPTKAHEYLFLLAKQERYYYDAAAIAEPSVEPGRTREDVVGGIHRAGVRHSPGGTYKQDGHGRRHAGFNERYDFESPSPTRNARTVWTITTQPYPEAHFATFPEELPRRCILTGSAPGDTVLDPFTGSGTTLAVAIGNGRHGLGIELNLEYAEMARRRIGPMFCEVAA